MQTSIHQTHIRVKLWTNSALGFFFLHPCTGVHLINRIVYLMLGIMVTFPDNVQGASALSQAQYSGEVHYARVPSEYWRITFKSLRALGLNTVSTYVFWNLWRTSR
jgi:hypothetical protein